MEVTVRAIGVVRSPYVDTGQIPQGPGARHEAEGTLDIAPEFELGLTDIEGFSHLYVLWVFDRAGRYDLLASPPTDHRPHGVFATRSPRRPSPIGLTVVELVGRQGSRLHVRGLDMLDGTPILDIKPYLSSIAIDKVKRGWLDEAEARKAAELPPADDPLALFAALYARAAQVSVEPDAMVLSTVDPSGRPSARYVLLKGFDDRGFVFYTNLGSRKARALDAHPDASLCFYWAAIGSQIRIEGAVERVADAEADAYFATRPRPFQIGAWASRQSAPLTARAALEARVVEMQARFEGRDVPRPPFWSGFRVAPATLEFWARDPARLHERIVYERRGQQWVRALLFP